ncbi:alpha/beta hydrolase [Siccirubricoccus phaeus]|uniref:alpha/beta hydrolase n=1 Tax=Siccirubricoccus phaeus TaxID=2595053 RepID=UPI0011F2CB31|nr:alpha/beta hydrolase [Siccirubricoccus phaeus]
MRRRSLHRLAASAAASLVSGCTPVIFPSGPATTQPAQTEDAFVMPDGARLPYRAWLPEGSPRAVILGLHGFGDYSVNAFDLPAAAFTAQGIALYAYDQRGFGAGPHRGYWPGTATLAADCITATSLVAARHPGLPLHILGESMGAAVAMVAATAASPPPVAGYILLAPGVRGRKNMSEFSRTTLEIAARLIPAVGFSGSAPGFAPSDNEEALRRWSRDPLTTKIFRVDFVYGLVDLMDRALEAASRFTMPALVLYGAHDRIVPPEPMRRLLRTIPPGNGHRIAYYPEGHHLLLRDRGRAVVIADILAWLGNPAAPLPSHADTAAVEWLNGGGARG